MDHHLTMMMKIVKYLVTFSLLCLPKKRGEEGEEEEEPEGNDLPPFDTRCEDRLNNVNISDEME